MNNDIKEKIDSILNASKSIKRSHFIDSLNNNDIFEHLNFLNMDIYNQSIEKYNEYLNEKLSFSEDQYQKTLNTVAEIKNTILNQSPLYHLVYTIHKKDKKEAFPLLENEDFVINDFLIFHMKKYDLSFRLNLNGSIVFIADKEKNESFEVDFEKEYKILIKLLLNTEFNKEISQNPKVKIFLEEVLKLRETFVSAAIKHTIQEDLAFKDYHFHFNVYDKDNSQKLEEIKTFIALSSDIHLDTSRYQEKMHILNSLRKNEKKSIAI